MIAPGIDSLGYSSTSRLGSACDDILTRSLLASSSSRRSTLLRGTADFSSIFASPRTLCYYYIPYTYCRCSPSHPVSRKQARTLSALWLFLRFGCPAYRAAIATIPALRDSAPPPFGFGRARAFYIEQLHHCPVGSSVSLTDLLRLFRLRLPFT